MRRPRAARVIYALALAAVATESAGAANLAVLAPQGKSPRAMHATRNRHEDERRPAAMHAHVPAIATRGTWAFHSPAAEPPAAI